MTTEGRKRKRLFGRGYISVNQATDANRNSFEMQVQQQRLAGEPLTMRSQSSPLFTDSQACARSPVQQLVAHTEGWAQVESIPQCRIPASSVERCACNSPAAAMASTAAAAAGPSAPVGTGSTPSEEPAADIEGVRSATVVVGGRPSCGEEGRRQVRVVRVALHRPVERRSQVLTAHPWSSMT